LTVWRHGGKPQPVIQRHSAITCCCQLYPHTPLLHVVFSFSFILRLLGVLCLVVSTLLGRQRNTKKRKKLRKSMGFFLPFWFSPSQPPNLFVVFFKVV
jgi:hypothetical protein